MIVKLISSFILVSLLVFLPMHFGLAVSEKTVGGSLVANINPKSPGPNEQVNINLLGYGYDINQSNIVWILNGKQIKQGLGDKSFTFTTDKLGNLSVVGVLLTTKEGKKIVKQLTITPGLVNLVWEADTHTPDFYQGASLPTSGSQLKVLAIPQITYNGEIIPTQNLVFNWKKDYKNLVRESGLGRNYIEFTAGRYPAKHNIEVSVEYPKLADSFYKKITIPLTNPKIIVYPYSPLVGIVNTQPIKNSFRSSTAEESFKAEGFFFPNQDINSGLINFSWLINDKNIFTTNKDRSILNTKTDTEASGEVRVKARAVNAFNSSIEASNEFNILLTKNLFNF